MTFSPEWDKEFREGRHLSRYPWSDLVSFVNRYAKQIPLSRTLELGCGIGPNASYFVEGGGGFYYGVDGSEEAVDACNSRYGTRYYKHFMDFACADFTKEIPFGDTKFDLIFDRAAVTHNDTESIKRCIELVKGRLKPGGKYIGIDWFSVLHSSFMEHERLIDEWTGEGYKEGPFKGVGRVHFSNWPHLKDLFKDFGFESLEHKITFCKSPREYRLASWNFCCTLK